MSNIAIITARGGSKRIPKKNIKDFCGKPIIAYSIEAAISSDLFDEVMVSTDDENIKKIALQYGAKVPFMRSKELSDDYATTADVLVEVIQEYKKRNIEFEYMFCLYPTAPFITSNKLINAMKLLEDGNTDSVIPIVSFSFPPQRSFVIEDNRIKITHPEYFLKRSQDLQIQYHDCGQFYGAITEKFLINKSLIMDNTKPIILSDMEVQDIDNEEDWKLAETKYRQMNQMENE